MSGEAELAVFKADRIKSEIITWVISSLLITPLLQLFANNILWFVSRFSSHILESVYKSAALGFRESTSFQILALIYPALVLGILGLEVSEISDSIRSKCEQKDKDNAIPKTKEELIDEISNVKTEIVELKIKIYILNRLGTLIKYIRIALIVGFALFICLSLVINYAEHGLITSFSHRLTILAPQISEQEEEEVRAQWARMKNKEDYRAVIIKMDQLAKEHKINLPSATTLWD